MAAKKLRAYWAQVVREQATNLRVAREVRDLIAAFAGKQVDAETAAWLQWAARYVEEIDPLVAGEPCEFRLA